MDLTLVMFTQEGERREFPVKNGKATIGRNGESEIQVSLGVISRRHCELTVKDDKIKIRDLGSSNGTYVNNKRVQQSNLHAGDTLTVGPVIFTLVVDGQPNDIKPVKTILDGKKKKKKSADSSISPPPSKMAAKPAKPSPEKKSEDTGSLDLEDLADLDLSGSDDSAAGDSAAGSLAELEELSKQRKGKS
ncbi:MAG TPA: FHA domain-containing protein [Phycisphaerae bacterium]|jgi:pSer/pThr/pTyr-binding forkhead associated (FHA) protein